jgi:hypothetical protein
MRPRLPHVFLRRAAVSLLLAGLLCALALAPRPTAGAHAASPRPIPSQKTEQKPGDGRLGPDDLTASAAVLEEFKDWAEGYAAGLSRGERGAELARRRREVLRDLIKADPARAIESALTPEVRRRLPPEVAAGLEEEVSGYGDFWVAISDEADSVSGRFVKGSVTRAVVLGGRTYSAFVYGRREAMTSKRNIPLHGIAVDGLMAVDESPVRLLKADDPRARAAGEAGAGVLADVGGTVRRFASRSRLDSFVQELTRREAAIGPDAAREGAESSARSGAASAAPAWTTGPKKVLYMRVDFPDAEGEPLVAAVAQTVIDEDADAFFADNSYGKTSLRGEVTPLLRMPRPTTYYGVSEDSPEFVARMVELLTDARAAARAAGHDPAAYDLEIVAFRHIPAWLFAGRASLGASGAWLNGAFSAETTIHELGHNYGLHHASFWNTSDGTVTGSGVSDEYGDLYDIMGSGDKRHHFNGWFKSLLGWLAGADVQTVTNSGVYRIQAQDSPSSSGSRALKIHSAHRADYWVEYRVASAGGSDLQSGALVHWGYDAEYSEFRKSNLLDMTPASDFFPFDAPLPVGETFTDEASGVSITPLRKLGTTPETLEVEVKLSKYVISGRVMGIFNSPLGGVTMTVGGTESAVTQTGDDGVFSVAVSPGGDYTLTPSMSGFVFDPPSLTFHDLGGSRRAPNFKALPPGTPLVQFEKAEYIVAETPGGDGVGAEGMGFVTLNVSRAGADSSLPSSVMFATADGTADSRKDYTRTLGTLTFAPGEVSKAITVSVTDDVLQEPPETFTVTLSNPFGSELGANSTATVTIDSDDATPGPNPVESASFNSAFFVRQHYLDFLGRAPDAAGLAFWVNEIESCGANQQCREAKKINVSAAFFLSIEFQETGYLVQRMYKAAFGDATSPNVPGTVPFIRLEQFLPDTQSIGRGVRVGIGDWRAQLEHNKEAFALEFVQRPFFASTFHQGLTPAEVVDRLNLNAGGVLSQEERDQLVAQLSADDTPRGRAAALRRVAEDEDLRRNESNRAFVLMQYYGYMRRNPDDPQDADFRGWKFWLDKLDQFNGNFVQAQMVEVFITSIEYKQRFGQ